MLKMLMDPMGGIVITNDGNAILREVGQSLYMCVYMCMHICICIYVCLGVCMCGGGTITIVLCGVFMCIYMPQCTCIYMHGCMRGGGKVATVCVVWCVHAYLYSSV